MSSDDQVKRTGSVTKQARKTTEDAVRQHTIKYSGQNLADGEIDRKITYERLQTMKKEENKKKQNTQKENSKKVKAKFFKAPSRSDNT